MAESCEVCGNLRHNAFSYWRGWLVYRLIVRTWPFRWGIPPMLATAGDYIYDERECRRWCVKDATPSPE